MITRKFFSVLSSSQFLENRARNWGPKLGATTVIAGETIEEAMEAVRKLNAQGLCATVDHLGEFVHKKEEALASKDYCIRTLEAIDAYGVDCNLSLKLTSLGLDVDRNLCRDNMLDILAKADELNIFVRIDMEDYAHLDSTLELFQELRRSYQNVGPAMQSYLHRAEQDTRSLKGVNLRMMKGAYKESPSVAYQKKPEVDANLLNIIKVHLLNGSYTAVATHDHNIIEEVKTFVREQGIPDDLYEFQMLYGFRTELQAQLVNEGYKVRVYVPFGEDWYGYFMRRLGERPQNIVFAMRGLLSK
ncbi:proline dehydrogenase family protein [Salisediminibacterium halotolerans]|uniref:proline dehydrogenase family protein n=1 Tax=Salisediminibacterium halotolerans TaxID=517425 RepID=UPI000EB385E8|nr:proline dehydrogenase family protein [Salisediminibacterium halotolerans]RLJ73287.1 L-proline dehydrogenase [Actinophytocola xinjiangensis]RPE86709.1 L-proline dehydrogenase [Salisediminibacterium halotolerans]TWG34084.1 L-proline dehydrogenase [Salisediminibacterium halotolerans]GEL07598.1 proline dehydrogenase 2 [Salisediminibacterium halotolerans]